MSRARILLVAVVSSALLGACGVPADDGPRDIPSNQVPFELLTPSTIETSTTIPAATTGASIFFVRSDKLLSVNRTVAAPLSLGSVLASLIQGPTSTETSSGIRSALGPQTLVLNAQVSNGTASVDLSDLFSASGAQEQILALAQLVYTATAVPGVSDVKITVGSSSIDLPRGDGTLTRESLRRNDYPGLALVP